MAQFFRHIGRIGDRKVAVIFRELPGENHMALVVYTQVLNQNIHDAMMSVIESASGQQAKDLADALNKTYTKDGRIILQVLHLEGMLKKIQTNQVVMTPAAGITIRLDELNQMLDEMEKGEEAVKKLAEFDASRGLQDPKDVARRMRGQQEAKQASKAAKQTAQAPTTPPPADPMSDAGIAYNLRQQAQRMAAEARSLLAESERLQHEAAQLDGATPAAPATPEINNVEQPTPKRRGRTRKVAVTG